jgi:hypothetical protein
MLWNGNECGKTKVMSISREPSPVHNMIYQKEMENVDYFVYLGSMILNYVTCTRELNSGLPWKRQHSAGRRMFSPVFST